MSWGSRLLLPVVLLSSCSDSAEPSPGTFRAQLTGARVATLSGSSNADRVSADPYPDLQFAIRMFAEQGNMTQVLVIRCRGDQPPAEGDYTLDPSGEECIGRYSSVLSTPGGGAIVVDSAAASSGTMTIGPSQPGQTAGSFSFSGTLIAGPDTLGTLGASGTFSADLL
jgi:hypothetical protein